MNRIKAETMDLAPFDSVQVFHRKEIKSSYTAYLIDESNYGDGKAESLFFPKSEAEVAAILKEMNQSGTQITVSSGRTGIVGGAVPLVGVILSMEKMNHVSSLGFDEQKKMWYVGAEAGIILSELVRKIERKDFNELLTQESATNQQILDRFLSDKVEYFLPPDPTEMTALLGGTVATNASGARTFKYGAMREWIRRIRVVLVNGDVLDITRGQVTASNDGKFEIILSDETSVEVQVPSYKMPQIKNSAGLYVLPGMDLIDLFIGCEGILGVITMVEVYITQKAPNLLSITAFLPSEGAAIEFVEDIRTDASPIKPEAIEYFDSNAVALLRSLINEGTIQIPSFPDDTQAIIYLEIAYSDEDEEQMYIALEDFFQQHGVSMETAWGGMESSDWQRMKDVRHAVPEKINSIIAKRRREHPELHKLGTDMAIPDEHLRTMMEFYKKKLDEKKLEYVIFGHIGNNHLHVNILPRDVNDLNTAIDLYLELANKAVEFGGTVSAEHGIGKLKRPFLRVMYGQEGIEQIRAVKRALDPKGILNAGVMIPEENI
ncbi:MAG: FAD-binding oxidoreductase [Candidatus Jordarchaeum sp.]|uniref:FAD-binding oxidoreductase n=1 Tax=Candidatus Jordarchaeum sp. TaxID=2823881 RepID=UPI00404B677E